jgi:hypothetical protein
MIPNYLKDHNFYYDVINADVPYSEHLDVPKKWSRLKVKNIDTAIRYVVLLYDRTSPLVKKHQNFEERKKAAMDYASSFGEISEEWMDDVIGNRDDKVIEMIIDFLKVQDDKLWSSIITNEELFLEYTKTLFKPIELISSDKDLIQATTIKEKIREAQSKVRQELKALYEEFYNGDKKLEEVAKGKKFSPEYLAKRVG